MTVEPTLLPPFYPFLMLTTDFCTVLLGMDLELTPVLFFLFPFVVCFMFKTLDIKLLQSYLLKIILNSKLSFLIINNVPLKIYYYSIDFLFIIRRITVKFYLLLDFYF